MIDDVHLDGEDSSAATENRSGEPPTDQGKVGVGGIEVFGAAPLVDEESPAKAGAPSVQDSTAAEPAVAAAIADAPSESVAPTPGEPGGEASGAQQPAPGDEDPASHTLNGTLTLLDGRLASIEDQLDSLSRMTGHLPPKLRTLGTKLEELAAPLADASTRSLMVDLFMVDDLSRAALARDDDPEAASRALGAVVKMLENLFEQRDVTAIPTDIVFDPSLHQAMERLPVDDPAQDGQILEVYRQGYRSGNRVLRFAEVGVAYYQPDPADPVHDDDPAPAADDPDNAPL